MLKKSNGKVEGKDLVELYDVLTGPTAVMFSDVGNAPAKVIKGFS